MQVEASEWQGRTGDSWAAEWRRTDRSFGTLTDRLLQRSRALDFAQVLDVGCGAGELSLAIARGRHDAHVTGVDISPQLVAIARERGANLGNAEFLVADAAQWRPSGAPCDLVISRHGVMFFADPVAAFANIAAAAAPGAQLLFSCFRQPSLNPVMTEVARLLPGPATAPDPIAPGPFAFADSARVEAILAEAGWRDIAFEPLDFAMVVGAGEDPVADALGYFRRIGPAARAARELAPEAYAAFEQRLVALAESQRSGGIVAMAAAAWLVSARKA